MLTDKTMARLAEDCGWMPLTIHNPPLGPATDYRDNNGNLMIDATGQLTDAGCWQAMTHLGIRVYPAVPAGWISERPGQHWWHEGAPETALMLAIQEAYADQEPPQ